MNKTHPQLDSFLILIGDDDDRMRMQLRQAMEQAGYQVAEASNGEQALAAYTKLRPDLILLDAVMPVMDGFTCCRQLRSLPGGDRTPVLMIARLEDAESIELAFAAGATDFITKPIHWAVLRQRVRRLLQASRIMEELRQQKAEAETSRNRVIKILESITDGFFAVDKEWRFTYINQQAEQLLQRTRAELLGKNVWEEFPEAVGSVFFEQYHQAVSQQVSVQFEEFYPPLNAWFVVHAYPASNGLSVYFQDITERKQMEEALQKTTQVQGAILNSANYTIISTDVGGTIRTFNTTAERLLGYAASEVIGKTTPIIIHDWNEVVQRSQELTQELGIPIEPGFEVFVAKARREGLDEREWTYIRKDGSCFPVLLSITALRDAQGNITGFFGIGSDITERKRVEVALRESEERWQLAVRGTNDGIWDWNVKTNEVFYSSRWKEMLGYEDHEIANHRHEWAKRVHPDDIGWVSRAIQDHFAKKTPFYISEYRVQCQDGSYKWILDRGQALWDEAGNVVRMAGSYTDITERKQAEEALRQSEEFNRRMLESSNDCIKVLDLEGRVLYLNPRGQQLLEIEDLSTCLYAEWVLFWEGSERQAAQAAIAAAKAGGVGEFQGYCPTAKGTPKWWEVIVTPIYNAAQQVERLLSVSRDITERRQAEEELQRQNLRSQLFAEITLKIRQSLQLDEILQATVTEIQKLLQADRVLIFRLWSNGYGQIINEAVVPGWPSVLGRGITDDCFGAEYLRRYIQGRIYTIADTEKAGVEPCLVEFLQQFGVKAKLVMPILLKEELWGLLIAHQCSSPRQWSSFEIELLRQIADQIGIALAQAQLLAEETRQRQELARSNAELQQFASVASHDLQEPLRKIQAFSNRLKAICGEQLTDQGRDYLERMQNAAHRMQALIDDLLILSRITTRGQPFVAIDLNQIAQEVLSDLELRIQQTDGHVEVGKMPVIEADSVQMRQLLQNLLSNSLKFHQSESPPIIKLYSQLLDREQQQVESIESATLCQIMVEDNGIGFDEKYLDRIFNVFQRLHSRSEYEGTGMGLAICRKIVERHRGSITAKSKPGQGSIFIVTIPIKQRRGENLE